MQERKIPVIACVIACVSTFVAGLSGEYWSVVTRADNAVQSSDESLSDSSNESQEDDPHWRLEHMALTMAEMAWEARRAESLARAKLDHMLVRIDNAVTGDGPRAQLAREVAAESQRCWEAYMEAQMAMEYPSPRGMRYGSISFMTIPLRREALILDRVAELSRVLGDDHEEGDLSAPQWPDCIEDE